MSSASSRRRLGRPRRLRPAGVWLAVFADKHSTAQYVVGHRSEECCG